MAHSHANHREITLKVVYFGPAQAGKTTILNYLHQALRPDTRGQLISVTTGSDQTLFFDFFPLPSPRLQGNALRVQIYTSPGDVRSESTRRALLEGVDGLVFVADSQRRREIDNAEALEQLRRSLSEMGLQLDTLPHIFAWNKRDLDDVFSGEELSGRLNPRRMPALETVAHTGRGVFDTLKAVTGLVLGEMTRRRAGRAGPAPSVASAGRRMQTVTDAQRALAIMTDRRADTPRGDPDPRSDPRLDPRSDPRLDPSPARPDPSSRLDLSARPDPSPRLDQAPPPLTGSPRGGTQLFGKSKLNATPRPLDLSRPPRLPMPLPPSTAPSGTGNVPVPVPDSAGPTGPMRSASDVKSLRGEPILLVSGPPGAQPPPNSEETQPRKRSSPTWLQPLAPEQGSQPVGPVREVWISHLLPRGSLRDQLHDVEVDLSTGRWAQAVRRATILFATLTATEASREPDEGPAWRALALNIPVDRYLRFREATRHAEAGTATQEDGLFALFFLLDTILRR